MFSSLARDFSYGFRMILRRPGLSTLASLALALGIGLTTLMFSALDAFFLQGLPYEDSGRLIRIDGWNNANNFGIGVTVHDLDAILARTRTIEGAAAFFQGTVNLASEGNPERVDGAFVSSNLFELLRVQPLHGRLFEPGESKPGAERVAVIAYSLWQRRFAGDPGALGQILRINGELVPIVGILPQGIHWPNDEEVYTNLVLDPAGTPRQRWGQRFTALARLAPGATLQQASTEITAIAAGLETEFPDANGGIGVRVEPLISLFRDDGTRQSVLALFLCSVFVLLIACGNVANLLLARAASRRKEMAIRTALGAERWVLVRQLLVESGLLAAAGALLGLLLASFGLKLLESALNQFDLPSWMRVDLGGYGIPFILGLTLLTTFLAGLFPSLAASRASVGEVLKDETRTGTSRGAGLLSRILVVVQIALTCLVLIGTGLIIRTVWKIHGVHLPFATREILTARLGLFPGDYPDDTANNLFRDRLTEALRGQPGVAGVTTFSRYPGAANNMSPEFRYVMQEGAAYTTERDLPVMRMNVVGEDFFSTLGVALLDGRDFLPTDVPPGSPDQRQDWLYAAIINEGMAEALWPGETPLGKRFTLPSGSGFDRGLIFHTVVGVAPDMDMNGVNDNSSPGHGFYLSLRQFPSRFFTIALRTEGDPMASAPMLQREIARLDPNLPLYWVRTLHQHIEEGILGQVITRNLFAVFGLAALFLACLGLYGVMSNTVTQRYQEIGIRMAIGANPPVVFRWILVLGSRPLLLGLAIGLAAAFGLTPQIRFLLFEMDPYDPLTFVTVTSLLTVVALAAVALPGARAARVNPMEALHHN